MKDLKLFYLFISLNIWLFKEIVEGIPPQTLNISDDAKGICPIISKDRFNGVFIKTYIAYDDDNIRKVMDSGEIIWDSENSGKMMRLFRTYSMNNRNLLSYMFYDTNVQIKAKYFQKSEYKWIEITSNQFDLLLKKLETERSFDLKDKPDPSIFVTQKHIFFGLPAMVIIPNKHISLVTITDDSELIWQSQNELEICTSVVIHGHPNDPQLVHINIKNGQHMNEMYFIKDRNHWIATIKNYFYYRLEVLDKIEEERKKLELDQDLE